MHTIRIMIEKSTYYFGLNYFYIKGSSPWIAYHRTRHTEQNIQNNKKKKKIKALTATVLPFLPTPPAKITEDI